MTGALSAVDVEEFTRHEGCRLQVEHAIDDIGDAAHPAEGLKSRQVSWVSGGCIGVAMVPGETALTRIPLRAYSIASDLVAAATPPLVNAARAAGTSWLACSTKVVVIDTNDRRCSG